MAGLLTSQTIPRDHLCPLAYLPSPSIPLFASIDQDESGSGLSLPVDRYCVHVT
jgi:hypothetical protein